MSTQRIAITECDGCGRTDVRDHIRIVGSSEVGTRMWPKTVHICRDCKAQGRYICELCDRVHSDEYPCREQLRAREMEQLRALEQVAP